MLKQQEKARWQVVKKARWQVVRCYDDDDNDDAVDDNDTFNDNLIIMTIQYM